MLPPADGTPHQGCKCVRQPGKQVGFPVEQPGLNDLERASWDRVRLVWVLHKDALKEKSAKQGLRQKSKAKAKGRFSALGFLSRGRQCGRQRCASKNTEVDQCEQCLPDGNF